VQDPEFALAQIVEIALRAMSPGINDPNTAVTCVNWLTDGLRDLEQYAPKSAVHVDSGGNARVIGHLNEFQHVVAAAYGLIRQVAWNSQMLTIGVLNSISLIAPFVEGEARKEVLKYTGAIGMGRLFFGRGEPRLRCNGRLSSCR
jgi:uncharacterized membrane protein